MNTRITFRYLEEILIAIGFSSNLLSYLFGNSSYSKLIIFLVIFFQLIIMYKRNFKLLVNSLMIVTFACICLLFISSLLKYNYFYTRTYLLYFIMYSLFAILSLQKKIDFQKLTEFIVIILFYSIPIVLASNNKDIGYLLGVSYNFLTGYLCTVSCLFFKKNSTTIFFRLICIVNIIVYTYFYLIYGNRGAILLIFIYIFLKWFLKKRDRIFGYIIRTASVLSMSLIFFYWIELLQIFSAFLQSYNLNIHAIDKTLNLIISNQNIDSGRTYLIGKLFSDVKPQELIFGKGIGYIETELGIYSHNLFIQSLFEGGILWFLILIVVIIRLIKLVYISYQYSDFILVATTAIFGQLLLSNVYWLNPIFWFLFYLAFYPRKNFEVLYNG